MDEEVVERYVHCLRRRKNDAEESCRLVGDPPRGSELGVEGDKDFRRRLDEGIIDLRDGVAGGDGDATRTRCAVCVGACDELAEDKFIELRDAILYEYAEALKCRSEGGGAEREWRGTRRAHRAVLERREARLERG